MHDTEAMQQGERLRFAAVVGLMLTLLSAGFALAGDAFDDPDEPVVCEPVEEVAREGDGSGEGCEEAEEPGEGGEQGDDLSNVEPALEVSEERLVECTEAAGLTPDDAPEAKPVPGEKTGLENAIAHVLWNCLGNDNHGQVNALEHLSWNLERKELRDEAKEARKAEREAAKAERKAAHDAAKAEREAAREAAKAAADLSHSS